MIQRVFFSFKTKYLAIFLVPIFVMLLAVSSINLFSHFGEEFNSEMIELTEGLDIETEEEENRSTEIIDFLKTGFNFSITSGIESMNRLDSFFRFRNLCIQPPSPPPNKAESYFISSGHLS